MFKSAKESMVNWQLERLQTLLASSRAMLSQSRSGQLDLAAQHLSLACERYNEALSALKYNRFDQALIACRKAFIQAGLAQALARYGAVLDAGIKTMESQGNKKKRTDGELLVQCLATCLAHMKAAIEYANLNVTSRAREFLDNAMDFYNDSLTGLKEGEDGVARRRAQAGLVCLSVASRVLKMDNELVVLPGWRTLSNPMLASPLREVDDLVDSIVQVREDMVRAGADVEARCRPYYEKAFKNLNGAIRALSSDSISLGQNLVDSTFESLAKARDILDSVVLGDPLAAVPESSGKWRPLVDLEAQLADIEEMSLELAAKRQEYGARKLDQVRQLYKSARASFRKGDYTAAEKLSRTALLELDFARQQLIPQTREED